MIDKWSLLVRDVNLYIHEKFEEIMDNKVGPIDLIKLYVDISLLMMSSLRDGFYEDITDEEEDLFLKKFIEVLNFRYNMVFPMIREDRCKKKNIN